MRIFSGARTMTKMDEPDLSKHVWEPFKALLKKGSGVLLVVGPPGSGRIRTLYSALRHIYHPGIKIMTAEDSIAGSIPGILQTRIKPEIDLSFARLLRALLRLDPDVIMVGELQDPDTAGLAFEAALRGRLVLSTLDAHDAVDAVTRLHQLGLEPNRIASSLAGVLALRPVRRTCSGCRQPVVPQEDLWRQLFETYPQDLSLYQGEGCVACDQTGHQGQVPLSELLTMEAGLDRAVNRGAGRAEIKHLALQGGMRGIIEDALARPEQVSLTEIAAKVPYALLQEYRARGLDNAPELKHETVPAATEAAAMGSAREQWVMSDPQRDWIRADELHARYKILMTGGRQDSGLADDKALFREFIAASYRKVCGQFGCRQVVFSLEERAGNVEIFAAPHDGPERD